MKPEQLANGTAVLRTTACLERPSDVGAFKVVDPNGRFGSLCAALWAGAAERAMALGASEPSALTVETRLGAVVAVRAGDRVLMGVVAQGVPPSVARYELERRIET